MKGEILGTDYETVWKILGVINHKKEVFERRAREKAYISMANLCARYSDSLARAAFNMAQPDLDPENSKKNKDVIKALLNKLPIEDIVIENLLLNKDFKDGVMFCLWSILSIVKRALPIDNEEKLDNFWSLNNEALNNIWKEFENI